MSVIAHTLRALQRSSPYILSGATIGAGIATAAAAQALAPSPAASSGGWVQLAPLASKGGGDVVHRVVEVARPGTGIETIDHEFDVPLDWAAAGGERLTVFAREVVSLRHAEDRESLPWLVFLQGGPGGASPRPSGASGWMKRALEDYRVLLLDQRGTGNSTLVSSETLVERFGDDDEAIAAYLGHFRADAIVADAEAMRVILAGAETKWSTLGQSYGGFLTLHYLSVAPEALKACFVAGGMATVTRTADDVYTSTYPVVLARNRQYYSQYPGDVEKVRAIVRALADAPGGGVALPGGGTLTPRRFLALGLGLGMTGGMEQLHWMIEGAFRHDGGGLAFDFLRQVENARELCLYTIHTRNHPQLPTAASPPRRQPPPDFGAVAPRHVRRGPDLRHPARVNLPKRGRAGALQLGSGSHAQGQVRSRVQGGPADGRRADQLHGGAYLSLDVRRLCGFAAAQGRGGDSGAARGLGAALRC